MSKKKTHAEFIAEARRKHGDKYDYLGSYVNARTKISVRCRACGGVFSITPNSHLSQVSGCEPCNRRTSRDGVRYSPVELLNKMRALHGDRYSYDLGDYRSVGENITIVCPEHGSYRATPNNHLRGKGCAKCASYGFNPNLPAYLYLLIGEHINCDVVKVGITNNPRIRLAKNRKTDGINWRMDGLAWYPDGFLPLRFEKALMNFFGTPFLGKERFFADHSLAREAFALVTNI